MRVSNAIIRSMFELRLQTYWADVDAAGIVYYPHFFRFVEQAEEESFRAAGVVCVDAHFKSTRIPDAIRKVIENA